MSRRLNFWWQIVNSKNDSLLNKFYRTQKLKPVKNDCVLKLEEDKEYLDIKINDTELKQISKNKFKKLTKEKIKTAAKKYLEKLKESHNKVKFIKYKKIQRADYITHDNLTHAETKLLFSLRSRMFPVLNNFRNSSSSENIDCRLCKSALEDQQHLLKCEVLRNAIPELQSNKTIKYEHIFGNVTQKVNAAKLLYKIVQERENMLHVLSIASN